MNPKRIILNNIRNEDLSKLHFVDVDYFDYINEDQDDVKEEIKRLRRETSIKNRILRIMDMAENFATFDTNNKFQCRSGANRSTVDIWRLYNNYFRPVSIFTMMKALYKLVIENHELGTLYCNDIDKQVFYCDSDFDADSVFIINELGVRFAEWRTIGL